ncbi:MAG: DEAD/DEAH box helicase family protein [Rhodospirillum sp.]|nr:DEAD/DEAH box helicase family protein [Rhodospirillum sp.]MCF8491755.1 DEAD/DEAH box helicase family protein [Rhodospirillum sp.]MCF8502684.1 DEAD/DEAH box helicase family protein [Rhodospirillum sp.]
MPSVNFEYLRNRFPEFADLGGFAEAYAHTDPASALVKLRILGEQLAAMVYVQLRLDKPLGQTFNDLLTHDSFQRAVPNSVRAKFHALRKHGNISAHEGKAETKTALWLLQEAAALAAWLSLTHLGIPREALSPYKVPRPPTDPKAVEQALENRTRALEKAVANHDKLKAEYQAVRQETAALKAIQDRSQKTANALGFSEAETRARLIDVALVDAGWAVGVNGANSADVTQEHELTGQPTKTGTGYADYVLWGDNGKPLAVIEAKKTALDPNQGKAQAKLYADALEQSHGQRPVIFYTNGYEIWMWDDAGGYPPRKVFGFYSKDSLDYLIGFQRGGKAPISTLAPDPAIAGRVYQIETVKRVCEAFEKRQRSALIVQATGTGKTRVAVALTELLIRAKWARRILFLCDRRELRKQARNAFSTYLTEPLTIVEGRKKKTDTARIHIATYPGMMGAFRSYDVGYFDLIIADESHRGVYNVFGDLFLYFDALQVGLTATPVEFVSRNTFSLFGCGDQDPTAHYPLERAIEERFLVPYEVYDHTTNFLREGIKYADLTPEQIRELEDSGEDPKALDFESLQIDAQIFNKDTNRLILRNLMDHGIKDATGQTIGKTILFARGHKHAVLLQTLFDDMYPQYGGRFCQVIDTHVTRAEQLIDDFKGEGSNPDLTLALSVDMLDTGIDVPEVVNLVFAKPVKSKVKFWQMIGRGTRLCEDLFGPGKHKTVFRIFDHWGNFEFFEQNKPEAEPSQGRSLLETLFAARVTLADTALRQFHPDTFAWVVDLIRADILSQPEETIAVREAWKARQTVLQPTVLETFSPALVASLRTDIAPLMTWVNARGKAEAYRFDLLVAEMQTALLAKSALFQDLKDELLNRINQLTANLNEVRAKAPTLQTLRSGPFWQEVTAEALEAMRLDLRGIMQFSKKEGGGGDFTKVIDVTDSDELRAHRLTRIKTIDMAVYRQRVEQALATLFQTDPTLQKIRRGEPVTETDLEALTSLVLTQHPDVDLSVLAEFYADLAMPLDQILRTIIGMDEEAVRARFTAFIQHYPALDSKQLRFLSMPRVSSRSSWAASRTNLISKRL